MRNILRTIVGVISLFILIYGCVTPATKPGGPPPSGQSISLADQYIAQAQEHEASGNLVEALDQYRLALTVDPENPLALEKTNQVKSTLNDLAEQHYQTGLSLHKKGEYARAKQELLTALRYNPEHTQAAEVLKTHELQEKQVKGFVLYTIQPNESISMLAQRYYGDYKKFPIIAEFNRLEDATKVKVGQQIKIPIVENLPFYTRPEDITTSGEEASESKPTEVTPVKKYIIHTVESDETLSKLALKYYGDVMKFPIIAQYNQLDDNASLRIGQEIRIPEVAGVPLLESPTEKAPTQEPLPPSPKAKEPQEIVSPPKPAVGEDQVANYRELGIELFNAKNYQDAIIEFNKILALHPDDQKAVDYTSRAYFEQGKLSFKKEAYDEAVKEFELALQYDSNCGDCRTYIQNCREKKQEKARKGAMELFDKKKYKEAIVEFNKILEQNPNDTVALDRISAAHFQQGLLFYTKEDYLASRDEFKASLQYNKKCDQCDEYIKKCEDTYKESHYNKGLTYFRQQNLDAAVKEWELVYTLDPEYRDVSSNLKQAKVLQERLESIKRSKTKEGKN